MNQNPLFHKKTVLFLYGISFVVALVQLNLGVGFALGLTASLIHQYLFIKYVDGLLFAEKFSVLGFIIGYVFRFMMFVFALTAAVVWPDFVSIIGVMFGLFVLKLLLYVKELSFKKGENR